jgi:hypothetical protein
LNRNSLVENGHGTGFARQVCRRAKPVKAGSAQVHLAVPSQSSTKNYGQAAVGLDGRIIPRFYCTKWLLGWQNQPPLHWSIPYSCNVLVLIPLNLVLCCILMLWVHNSKSVELAKWFVENFFLKHTKCLHRETFESIRFKVS